MRRLLFFTFFMLFLFSCGDKNSSNDENTADLQEKVSNEITAEDIESLEILEFGLSSDGKIAVEDWAPFQTLMAEIENLKLADFTYFTQEPEIIRTQVEELRKSIPDSIKSKPIQARLLALNTKMLLLNNLLRLQNISKKEKLESIREFLVAQSNLLLQINKKLELDSNFNVQKSQSPEE